ncbi:MAG: hypothetical protein JXL84_07445 [Deltaproteobacteria bacterium]|nr:hypothetical protein [Deltaproteobacteria bacterium]
MGCLVLSKYLCRQAPTTGTVVDAGLTGLVSFCKTARHLNTRSGADVDEEIRGAVKTVLQKKHLPRSSAQIRKELPKSIRISPTELNTILEKMAFTGTIFSWPQNKFWHLDPRTETPRLILRFLSESSVATASRLKTALKVPLDFIQPALKELLREGRIHVWQPGKTPHYCVLEPADTARGIIIKALASGPLTEGELINRVRERLPGYQTRHLREHASHAHRIIEHPRYGKVKTRYGLRPPEPGPYLSKALQEIHSVHDLLGPFHVTLEAIHEVLGRELGLRPGTRAPFREPLQGEPASHEAESLILEGIPRLQPPGQRRALVSIRELRRSVNLLKGVFDQAVLSLALQGKVALHHHDFPSSLSPEERDQLVRDEQGTYYVGIGPKEVS